MEIENSWLVKYEGRLQLLHMTKEGKFYICNGNFYTEIDCKSVIKLIEKT